MSNQENTNTLGSAPRHQSIANKLLDAVKNEAESVTEVEPTEKQIEQAEVIFSWSAPEYIQHQKTARWYVIATVIALAFTAGAVITANWTMAIAILVFAGVYEFTQRFHPPKIVDIHISELGIHLGHMFYPFSSMQAFWIMLKPGLKTLNIRVHRQFYSDVVIQLMDQDAAKIRSYLVGQIPEWEGKDERLQDLILRLLKL
jgi:hypothetical protein